MPMNPEETHFHRTLVQLLIDSGQRELAAVMIDGAVEMLYYSGGFGDPPPYGVSLDVPTAAYELISGNPTLKQALVKTARTLGIGRLDNDNTEPVVRLRVKYQAVEEGWEKVAREMIINWSGNNQATVSKKLFQRERREMLTYNELNYASQSEIKIALEMEDRHVLFFPLAVGVRAETGQFWKDHREVDFLVCAEGNWGILEVSYHPDRYEKDAEKDVWFKRSGILCIQHYTAERCYKEPSKVVDEFLDILAKHGR